MNIQEDKSESKYQVDRCLPGEIWINQKKYTASVLLTPHLLITDWPVSDIRALKSLHFNQLFTKHIPQILIIGTGAQLIHPSMTALRELYQRGIGIEIMDSRRAAYTFVALSAENRNVAAGIII